MSLYRAAIRLLSIAIAAAGVAFPNAILFSSISGPAENARTNGAIPSVQPLPGSKYEPVSVDDLGQWLVVSSSVLPPDAIALESEETSQMQANNTPPAVTVRSLMGAEWARSAAPSPSVEPTAYRALDFQYLQPTFILVGNTYYLPGTESLIETPEPGSLVLLFLGLALLAARGRRSNGRRSARAFLFR